MSMIYQLDRHQHSKITYIKKIKKRHQLSKHLRKPPLKTKPHNPKQAAVFVSATVLRNQKKKPKQHEKAQAKRLKKCQIGQNVLGNWQNTEGVKI